MLASNRALHIFIIRSWKGVKKYENVVGRTSSVRRHFNFAIECLVHNIKIRVYRVKSGCKFAKFSVANICASPLEHSKFYVYGMLLFSFVFSRLALGTLPSSIWQ